MVLLTITPTIASALNSLPPSTRDELSLPPTDTCAISHAQLIALSRHLISNQPLTQQDNDATNGRSNEPEITKYTLNTLLRGTTLYRPPPPPKPEPTPEYLALKASLTAAAEASKYAALLNPSTHSHSYSHTRPYLSLANSPSTITDADTDDDDTLTPSVVLNILLSTLFTGFAVYWALSNFRIPSFITFTRATAPDYPGAVASQPARVFLALIVALVVGVAEVGVYAAYLKKVEVARGREGRVVERKVVVGEVGGVGEDDERDGEGVVVVGGEGKEEIWGKGINGGARRRVKEKWRGRGGDES
ncbi:hypothetical protein FQN52_003765 [Onygenales sp. PD_12]|nr:hypothetical protein FQN53_001360 [Emmonsiellopsis sp. PD_33]KAK2792288.1 hypothetical protein FQN52_003765 [Onygenales sp. PD_12]KAK2800607.1 hypothetical protein FQN51_005990 [Onygenales sp. PD_10]